MDVFKDCPNCGKRWARRTQFLEDAELELVGYQPDFRDLVLGLMLFNHHACRTTLAITAESVKDLYDGPVYTERRTGSEHCKGHCLRPGDLDRCEAQCECAWVREVLQIIASWPKQRAAAEQLETADL